MTASYDRAYHGSVAERLAAMTRLHEKAPLTDEEYQAKRAEIIREPEDKRQCGGKIMLGKTNFCGGASSFPWSHRHFTEPGSRPAHHWHRRLD